MTESIQLIIISQSHIFEISVPARCLAPHKFSCALAVRYLFFCDVCIERNEWISYSHHDGKSGVHD
jgi:hypothetical protein